MNDKYQNALDYLAEEEWIDTTTDSDREEGYSDGYYEEIDQTQVKLIQDLVNRNKSKQIKNYNGIPICPVCNSANYIHNDGGVESKNAFCSHCGQRLDWIGN